MLQTRIYVIGYLGRVDRTAFVSTLLTTQLSD